MFKIWTLLETRMLLAKSVQNVYWRQSSSQGVCESEWVSDVIWWNVLWFPPVTWLVVRARFEQSRNTVCRTPGQTAEVCVFLLWLHQICTYITKIFICQETSLSADSSQWSVGAFCSARRVVCRIVIGSELCTVLSLACETEWCCDWPCGLLWIKNTAQVGIGHTEDEIFHLLTASVE